MDSSICHPDVVSVLDDVAAFCKVERELDVLLSDECGYVLINDSLKSSVMTGASPSVGFIEQQHVRVLADSECREDPTLATGSTERQTHRVQVQ